MCTAGASSLPSPNSDDGPFFIMLYSVVGAVAGTVLVFVRHLVPHVLSLCRCIICLDHAMPKLQCRPYRIIEDPIF